MKSIWHDKTRKNPQGFWSKEGIDAVDEAIRLLRSVSPLRPLSLSGGMPLSSKQA